MSNWAVKGMYPLQRKVSGKRAGVLGLGRIGLEVARRLQGFGMEIAYCSRAPKPEAKAWTYVADPVVLAAQSDFFLSRSRHPQPRTILSMQG